jgi:hypothetical protein
MKPDLGVVHGRFQILHNDHMRYILAARDQCRHLVIGITNPDAGLTRHEPVDPGRSDPEANPLTFWERYWMIRVTLQETGVQLDAYSIVPLPINVPEKILDYAPPEATYYLTIYDDWGREKLKRLKALGLKTHVLWEKSPDEKGINGTTVRNLIMENKSIDQLTPPAVARLVSEWNLADRLLRSGPNQSA